MFTLRNLCGNIIKVVETEREKEKLEALGYKIESATTEINLEKMTVAELDNFANENGIDLSGCYYKAEKIETIKNLMK